MIERTNWLSYLANPKKVGLIVSPMTHVNEAIAVKEGGFLDHILPSGALHMIQYSTHIELISIILYTIYKSILEK